MVRMLNPHPLMTTGHPGDHVWTDTKRSKTLNKLRLGDIGDKWGTGKRLCKSCNKRDIHDMREHVLLDCDETRTIRYEGPVGKTLDECRALNMSRVETLQQILAGTSGDYMAHLHTIVTAWEDGQENR